MEVPQRVRSLVWRYFEILQEDICKVRCLICPAIISRGGVGKSAGTSCMRNHIRWKHPDVFTTALCGQKQMKVEAAGLRQGERQPQMVERFLEEMAGNMQSCPDVSGK